MPPARPSDLPGVEGAERPAPKTLKAIKPDAAGRKAARAGDAPKDADLETPADAGRPDRPGSFGNQSVRVPGPFHRKNTVASHTKKPDLELGGDGRTTLGVFGNADLMDKTDLRNSTSKSVRDVGAGLTLQYRFGQ